METNPSAVLEMLAHESRETESLESTLAALKEQLRFEAAECALAEQERDAANGRLAEVMALLARFSDRAVRLEVERDSMKAELVARGAA